MATNTGNMPLDEFWSFIPPGGAETSLQNYAWNISTFGGSRWALPTLRGQDYEHPYRAGQAWRAKYPNSRTVTLAMWTAGISQATSQPDTVDQRLRFNNNFQKLRQLFWTRNAAGSAQGQLVRRWWLTQNNVNLIVRAAAMAEIAGSMEPTMNGRTGASFSVDLLLADPYFYGASQQNVITTTGGTITNPGEGIAGEGYPSTVNAYTITVTGSPVTVTNTTAGCSVTYSGSQVNQPVTLDILNMLATDSAGTSQGASVAHSGSRIWLPLLPGPNAITVSSGTATFNWCPPYI